MSHIVRNVYSILEIVQEQKFGVRGSGLGFVVASSVFIFVLIILSSL